MEKIYKELCSKIKNADAVLIGASNGLSISEGLHLFADNEAFEELFGDMKANYGVRNIFHGMTAVWPSETEKWRFISRLLNHYCVQYQPSVLMKNLKKIIGEKDYFILTSNGECHFEMSGFNPEKIWEIEGTWLNMQCAHRCHDTLYPTLELAEKIVQAERNGMDLQELVPVCPRCKGAMQIHMQTDYFFIPNHTQKENYQTFLRKYHGKNLIVLELGIGWRNQLIKAPLMRLVADEPNATYITINLGEVYIPDNIKEKSFGLDGYLNDILTTMSTEMDILNKSCKEDCNG